MRPSNQPTGSEHVASPDPRSEYVRRLDARRESLALEQARYVRISYWRGFFALGGLAAALAVFAGELLSFWWLLVPAVVFLGLVVLHEVVARSQSRAEQAVRHYERAVGRLDWNWIGKGITGIEKTPEGHLFASDLDIFGEGSLFELLCTAHTRAGEEALAKSLLHGRPVSEILRRQAAVEELRERLDLREEMAILAKGVRAELKPSVLKAWATEKPSFGPRKRTVLTVVAWGLPAFTIAAAVLWKTTAVGPMPLIAFILLQVLVFLSVRARLSRVVGTVATLSRELDVLVGILRRLEREPVESELLVQLCKALRGTDRPASEAVAQLSTLVSWLDARRNQFFAPIAFLLSWGLHFGLAIERWRLGSGRRIPLWIDTIGEIEALCALAAYAYEHPKDPFPELVEHGPLFDAQALGHPLLGHDGGARNDVHLGSDARIWLVSGSNMSGKSTLLRSVGINAVLAMAGGPVRAHRLRLSPMGIGATIRIQDSLMKGESRFYAEVSRLQQIMKLAEREPPLLFLLDEILHGTNSRDRRVGAAAIIRQLLDAGAIGLVTTHDLAVADAAGDFDGLLHDVHFEDRLVDGRLTFDYRVRPGAVQRSNALEWMRALGLKV
jgi:hypothetical protein